MDRVEAAQLLGVAPDADPSEVRSAFRRLLHAHHPDRSAAGDATSTTRSLIEAHRTLSTAAVTDEAVGPSAPAPTGQRVHEPPDSDLPSEEVEVLSGDTLSIACPADEAFVRLVEVGHRIGDVTYVDRLTGMLEVLVRTPEGHALSLVTSLQGRANGCTEVFVTLEPVGVPDVPVPPVAEATALLAHHLSSGGRR